MRDRARTVRLHASWCRWARARRLGNVRSGWAVVELVAVDIGGTHARFAIADVDQGRVTKLGDVTTLSTAAHASLQTAWEAFGEQLGRKLPRAAAIAAACPITGDTLKLTNNPWIIRPALIGDRLGV